MDSAATAAPGDDVAASAAIVIVVSDADGAAGAVKGESKSTRFSIHSIK